MSGMKPNVIAYSMRVSREQMIAEGHAKPTPAEVDAYNADARRWWEQSKVEWQTYLTARVALDSITDTVARQVLDLHAITDRKTCEGCDADGFESEQPEWPCRTTSLIAAHFGIPMPTSVREPRDEPNVMPPEGFKPIDWSAVLPASFINLTTP